MNEEKQEKKKYWLKLDKDFLKSPQMKVIKNMPNGKDYIIFYLSLMLESVETVGHLRFTSLVPYNAEMLASVTDTNVDIVKNAIKIFCELGMMQIFDDGTIFMTEVPKMTGKECESAERVRKFRLKQQNEKEKLLQCNNDVTKCNNNKDKDKDKDKNINNKYLCRVENNSDTIKEVIDYVNELGKTNFKYTTKKTRELINARIKDGCTVEDLKKLVYYSWDKYIKNKKDFNGTPSEYYYRPETIFNNKFEAKLEEYNRKAKQ